MALLDPRAPRFGQAVVGALALAAFVADAPWLAGVVFALLVIGVAFGPSAQPLSLLWRRVLVPAFRLGAPTSRKPAAPVRFAQGVGAAFVGAALVAFVLSAHVVGWALVLVVSALALLAAVTDVCVGCEVYVWLRRWTARAAVP